MYGMLCADSVFVGVHGVCVEEACLSVLTIPSAILWQRVAAAEKELERLQHGGDGVHTALLQDKVASSSPT